MMVSPTVDAEFELASHSGAFADAGITGLLDTHLALAHMAELDTRTTSIRAANLGIVRDPCVPVLLPYLGRRVEQMQRFIDSDNIACTVATMLDIQQSLHLFHFIFGVHDLLSCVLPLRQPPMT